MSLFSFKNNKSQQKTVTTDVKAPSSSTAVEDLLSDDKPKYQYELDHMLEIKQKVQDDPQLPEGLIDRLKEEGLEKPETEGSMGAFMYNISNNRNDNSNNAGEGRAIFGSEKQQVDNGLGSLQTTEDAYRIKSQNELSELDKVKKFVNGVLNKLTPEKYEALSEQLVGKDEILNTEEAMNLTIQLIFDRAANQPSFCEMYASLSKRMSDREKQSKKGGDLRFRSQFIQVVQGEFERCKKILERSKVDPEQTIEERDLEELLAKKRQLGNVHFVGELYKTQMLSNKVIHWVIPEILFKKDGIPAGEEIEVLCKLLNTVGREMELRKRGEKFDHSQKIDEYFSEMEKLAHNGRFDKRIQFSIINTVEARAKGWPQKAGTAKKLKDLEKESDDAERKKLAGQGNVSHSGESNAWGSGATVHKSVGGKARKDEAKAAAAAKKNAKDEWQTTGTSKKGSTKNTAKQASGGSGAAGSGGSKAAGTPQPQPTKSNAYSSIQSGDKKKKKKDKKEKKHRDKDEDEKKARDKPPMEVDSAFRAKVGTRAMECMMEVEKNILLEEDMKHYEEEYNFDNLCPVVVMEVLRAIAVENDEESRDMLSEYINFLTSTSLFKRDDIMRGIAYFIANSAMEDLVSDKPKAYSRAAVVLKKLLPSDPEETSDFTGYKEINSVFRNGCRMIKLCFQELAEEERPYEDVQELYAIVVEGLWRPLHADMKFETDIEEKTSTVLNALIAFNHKTSWPLIEEEAVITFMIKYLIEDVQLFDTETLSSVFNGMKGSSKIAVAAKHLKEFVGGGEEEEVEEEAEEEEEAEQE